MPKEDVPVPDHFVTIGLSASVITFCKGKYNGHMLYKSVCVE